MTKPDEGAKSGQFVMKYILKRGVSVRMRKPDLVVSIHERPLSSEYSHEITTRMRFSHASKKKNDLLLNILTSMTLLAADTASRAVMFIALITLSTT